MQLAEGAEGSRSDSSENIGLNDVTALQMQNVGTQAKACNKAKSNTAWLEQMRREASSAYFSDHNVGTLAEARNEVETALWLV